MSLKTVRAPALEQPVTGSALSAKKARRWEYRHQGIALVFIAPALLLFLVFIAYGIVFNLYNSFLGNTYYGTTFFVGGRHFASMLKDPYFWQALRNNGTWFVITVGVQTTVAYLLAFLLDMRIPGTRIIKAIIFVPVVLSPSVVGVAWRFLYDPYQGPLTWFWHNPPNWLGSPQLALVSTAIVNIWQWTGFSMLICLAALQNIPRDLREAAAVDGAGYWATAWHVLLPLLQPATATMLILGLIGSLQTFGLIFIMTAGGPGMASQVLGTYLFQQAFLQNNMGYGSAISIILLAITLILTVIQTLFFTSKRLEF